MQYRNFGRTGVKVSPLCLGTMIFGSRAPEAESIKIIANAVNGGINFIDTANVYNRGISEEIVGKALAKIGGRDRIFLATKAHGKMDDEDPNAAGNSRRHIMHQCEASLKRLKTDYIDLYQIHRPQSDIPIDETLRALDDLVRQGKIRYIGTSTFAAWQLMEAIMVAKELGLNRFVSEQPPYHLLDRRIERELIPFAQTWGYGILSWSPLAEGFFSGKYSRQSKPDHTEARLSDENAFGARCLTEEGFAVLDVVNELAKEKNATPSQVAIAWVIAQPGITSCIIGPRTPQQLEDNFGALEIEITEDDQKRLDEVAPPGEVIARYYQGDFGPAQYR